MKVHVIQIVHIINAILGVVVLAMLISANTKMKSFIANGSELSGFGNFVTFAYPATFVYMFIPVASGVIYSLILGCDFSPNYSAWLPSRTLRSTIALVAGAVFLAALLPALPGADVMTSGSGLDCAWTNYMQWKVIFNNPDVFTWVTDMDDACTVWKAADGLCWVLFLGWLLEVGLYMRAAKRAASPLPEVPMADMKQKY